MSRTAVVLSPASVCISLTRLTDLDQACAVVNLSHVKGPLTKRYTDKNAPETAHRGWIHTHLICKDHLVSIHVP